MIKNPTDAQLIQELNDAVEIVNTQQEEIDDLIVLVYQLKAISEDDTFTVAGWFEVQDAPLVLVEGGVLTVDWVCAHEAVMSSDPIDDSLHRRIMTLSDILKNARVEINRKRAYLDDNQTLIGYS